MGNVVFLIFYLGPLLSTTTRTLSRTTQHFLGFSLIIVPPHIFDSHIRSTVSWGVSGARMFPAARHKYPHPHIHPHPISPMPFGRDALADRWSIKKNHIDPVAQWCHYLLRVNTGYRDASEVRACLRVCWLYLCHISAFSRNSFYCLFLWYSSLTLVIYVFCPTIAYL